ncbi:hypothetical protein P5V15_009923 [Pogonomyrmex californicus]
MFIKIAHGALEHAAINFRWIALRKMTLEHTEHLYFSHSYSLAYTFFRMLDLVAQYKFVQSNFYPPTEAMHSYEHTYEHTYSFLSRVRINIFGNKVTKEKKRKKLIATEITFLFVINSHMIHQTSELE